MTRSEFWWSWDDFLEEEEKTAIKHMIVFLTFLKFLFSS